MPLALAALLAAIGEVLLAISLVLINHRFVLYPSIEAVLMTIICGAPIGWAVFFLMVNREASGGRPLVPVPAAVAFPIVAIMIGVFLPAVWFGSRMPLRYRTPFEFAVYMAQNWILPLIWIFFLIVFAVGRRQPAARAIAGALAAAVGLSLLYFAYQIIREVTGASYASGASGPTTTLFFWGVRLFAWTTQILFLAAVAVPARGAEPPPLPYAPPGYMPR